MQKEIRYDWNPIDERRGNFEYIDKHDLKIDALYQRNPSEHRVINIAREWSFSLCLPLTVSRRWDGSNYVMDGQHRLNGAMKRDTVSKLPCYVFTGLSIQQEAETFRKLNTVPKSAVPLERFVARLAEGDKIASHLDSFLATRGYHFGRGGGGCKNIKFVNTLYNAAHADVECTNQALDICFSIQGDSNEHIPEDIFTGIYLLLADGQKFDEIALAKLRRAGIQAILANIRNIRIALGDQGGYRSAIEGILKVVNFRRADSTKMSMPITCKSFGGRKGTL